MLSSAVAREWNLNLPVSALAVNRDGDCVAVALGDGTLRLFAAHKEAERPAEMALHGGVSLSLQPDADGHAFLSGGDDGRLLIVDPRQMAATPLAELKNKWIDHVASSAEGGNRAYATGKELRLLNDEGREQGAATLPSSAGGLAFSPNGKRLAASHYNGVSLWWTNAKEFTPTTLSWKGSHLGLIWHPDGKIVLSSMQEGALHGWRFSDDKEMQMQGYAAKIRSMEFTAKGRWLATSGASQVICWPFFGGGPWGRQPLTLGGGEERLVTRIAAHPKDEMIAAGYEDGMIMLAPLDGRVEMMIYPPHGGAGAGVVGLAWNGAGDCLFAALENGAVLLFTIESVKRFVAHA